MERKSFADMDCSVAQCLEVVGEWWSMLVVRDAFLGVTRFDAFQERLGISRNILQQRLARLVDAGVLRREPYCEHPRRYDYRLTDKGRDLWPVLTAMRQWGDPVSYTHLDVYKRQLRDRPQSDQQTPRSGIGARGPRSERLIGQIVSRRQTVP